MKAGRFSRKVGLVLAGGGAVLASTLIATSAQAATASTSPPPTKHTTSVAQRVAEARFDQLRGAGRTFGTPRQMTSKQIAAVGLGKFATASGGCWYLPFYDTNTAILWFGTSENWCGNGSKITYAAAGNCGGTRYPTYNYYGCSKSEFYGAGWPTAQQQVTWQICIIWVPWPVSTCLDQESPSDTLTFKPDGNYSVWYH